MSKMLDKILAFATNASESSGQVAIRTGMSMYEMLKRNFADLIPQKSDDKKTNHI